MCCHEELKKAEKQIYTQLKIHVSCLEKDAHVLKYVYIFKNL
jgi:hypothetical protein